MESKSKRDMSMPAAIIIVVLAAIVVGIWYYYQKNGSVAEVPIDKEPQKKMLTVRMAPLNDSGQMGMAVLREKDGKVHVDINMLNAPMTGSEPAHIHLGGCPNPGEVKHALTSVQKGVSSTMIDTTLDQIFKELPLAINIHASENDMKTYTACGDILEVGLVPEKGGK